MVSWRSQVALCHEPPSEADLVRGFAPVSTATNELLVLRNCCVMHRTPLLTRAAWNKEAQEDSTRRRQFIWMPFNVFSDSQTLPIALESNPSHEWEAAVGGSPELRRICEQIESGLSKHRKQWREYCKPLKYNKETLENKGEVQMSQWLLSNDY